MGNLSWLISWDGMSVCLSVCLFAIRGDIFCLFPSASFMALKWAACFGCENSCFRGVEFPRCTLIFLTHVVFLLELAVRIGSTTPQKIVIKNTFSLARSSGLSFAELVSPRRLCETNSVEEKWSVCTFFTFFQIWSLEDLYSKEPSVPTSDLYSLSRYLPRLNLDDQSLFPITYDQITNYRTRYPITTQPWSRQTGIRYYYFPLLHVQAQAPCLMGFKNTTTIAFDDIILWISFCPASY